MKKLLKLRFLVFFIIIAASNYVYAQDMSEDEDGGYLSSDTEKNKVVNMPMWLGLGVRAGGGANILFAPKDASPLDIGASYLAAPFEDGGGGMAGGGGVFIETRWFKGKFGLDIGLFNERNRIWCDESVNGTDGNKFTVTYSIVRVPILLELHKVKRLHRFSLGLGPEIAVSLKSTNFEIDSDIVQATNNKIKLSNDLMIALNFGWGMKFGDWVLGFDFKTAYNVTSPMDYSERVMGRTEGYTIVGAHTLDMRLLVSFMYEIGLGPK